MTAPARRERPAPHRAARRPTGRRSRLAGALAASLMALAAAACGPGTDPLLRDVEELCGRGKLSAAQELLEVALETRADDFTVHRELGYIAWRRGLIPGREFNFRTARDHLVEAARLAPTDPRTNLLLGRTLQYLGENEAARDAFEVAALHAPEDEELAEGLVRLAMLTFESEPDRARTALDRALAIDAESFQALTWLSRVALAEGDVPRARTLVKRALRIEPDYSDANYQAGGLYLQAGELDKAELAFARAVEVSADLYPALFALAQVQERQARLDEAVHTYRRVLRLQPAHIRANVAAARLLLLRGELDEAGDYLDEVLRRNPSHQDARSLQERLRELLRQRTGGGGGRGE